MLKSRRRLVLLMVLGVVLVALISSAMWAFGRPYPKDALGDFAGLEERFPLRDPGDYWSEGKSTAACLVDDDGDACEVHWTRSNDANSTLTAYARAVAIEEPNRAKSSLTFLFGPERWIDSGIETEWSEVAEDVEGLATDDSALYCQSWGTSAVPDGCAWTYWARYGQYVVALRGGSETYAVSQDDFEAGFVRPADEFIAQRLGIASE